jgi:hypothetical protein
MRSDKVALYERRVDSVEEVLNLRGSLRGRMVLGGADPGFSPPSLCQRIAWSAVIPGAMRPLGRTW